MHFLLCCVELVSLIGHRIRSHFYVQAFAYSARGATQRTDTKNSKRSVLSACPSSFHVHSAAVAPRALDSLWSRCYVRRSGGWGGGESIGVTECSSSAYISSSLCPGQRVQWLRTVFSIPSPTHPLTVSPSFPTVLFPSTLEFHPSARG